MALFKISKGLKANLPSELTEGYCWYTYNDSKFYIDYKDENGTLVRKALNAQDAETLTGASLSTILNSSDVEIPTSKAVLDALNGKADAVHTHESVGTSVDNMIHVSESAGVITNALHEVALNQSGPDGYACISLQDGKATYEADQHKFIGSVDFTEATVTGLSGDSGNTTLNITNGEGACSLQQSFEEDGTVKGSNAYGKYSTALNQSNEAYQRNSFVIGGDNKVGLTEEEFNTQNPSGVDKWGTTYDKSNSFANAGGQENIATGRGSHIGGGYKNEVHGDYSGIVAGGSNKVESDYSGVVAGYGNTITGNNSAVLDGININITGENSGGGGTNIDIQTDNTHAFGSNLKSNKRPDATMVGRYNNENSYALFQVGSGWHNEETGVTHQRNSFEVFENGVNQFNEPVKFVHEVDFSNATVIGLDDETIATLNITEANTTITLQNLEGLTSINWGDGTIDTNLSHTYTTVGTYQCKIYSVTTIGEKAFLSCGIYGSSSLTSIVIGDSVTTIGKHAFGLCIGLTSVVIGDSVTTIGEHAFQGCNRLTSVVIPNSVTSIGKRAFDGCSKLTSITIPNSVTSIGDYAFYGCYDSISITIPNSIISIGAGTFASCTSLTSVVIPDSVISIGAGTFASCTSLTSVVIPNNVTSIDTRAFNSCSNLTKVVFNNPTPITYDSTWFTTIPTIVVPKDYVDTYKTAWVDVADYIISETPATQEWVNENIFATDEEVATYLGI